MFLPEAKKILLMISRRREFLVVSSVSVRKYCENIVSQNVSNSISMEINVLFAMVRESSWTKAKNSSRTKILISSFFLLLAKLKTNEMQLWTLNGK